MKRYIKNFVNDESGQDLVEYALLLSILAVAGVATLVSIGGLVSGDLTAAKTAISGS